MKRLLTTLLFVTMVAISYHASAATVSPNGGFNGAGCATQIDPVFNTPYEVCWDGAGTTSPAAFDAEDVAAAMCFEFYDTNGDPLYLNLLYKSNYDDGSESGTYQDNYSTAYSGDPNDALITSGVTAAALLGDETLIADIATCAACFLYVKDGSNDPIWYIFDISTWDGVEDLDLTDFWPQGVGEDGNPLGGAISHVAIFGVEGDKGLIPPVPIPAAAWLFGSGLLGLVGVARRKAVA